VRSWSMELKEELHNTGSASMWKKWGDCNLREIRMVKDRCNYIERQNILAELSEESLLALNWGINFSWGKKLYTEWCSTKERSGMAWLLAGLWQLKGVRQNTAKGRWPLCLGEEDARHVLLDCLETRNWRLKFLNDKWLNMNKIVAHRKMLRCTNKDQIRNLEFQDNQPQSQQR
jgi:hypothetical protein